MVSSCAACKFSRGRCSQACVFAPPFPSEQPNKFACVNKVFGASNVAKLLNELPFNQRDDAVNSLVYDAEARLRHPVYGSIGLISALQQRLNQLQYHIENSRKELATYVGPQAMLPILQPPQPHFMSPPPQYQRPSYSSAYNLVPSGQSYNQQQQQQIFEAQQLAAVNAVAREQPNEMFRAYGEGSSSSSHHQNQAQVEISRFNNGFDSVPARSVTITGFNQLSSGGTAVTGMSLGDNFVDSPSTNNSYYTDQQLHHHHQHQHHEAQQLHHHHQQQHHEAQQLHHHHQHQHHEAQLFIPTQSSQPLPLQKQETQTQTQPNSESEESSTKFDFSFTHDK